MFEVRHKKRIFLVFFSSYLLLFLCSAFDSLFSDEDIFGFPLYRFLKISTPIYTQILLFFLIAYKFNFDKLLKTRFLLTLPMLTYGLQRLLGFLNGGDDSYFIESANSELLFIYAYLVATFFAFMSVSLVAEIYNELKNINKEPLFESGAFTNSPIQMARTYFVYEFVLLFFVPYFNIEVTVSATIFKITVILFLFAFNFLKYVKYGDIRNFLLSNSLILIATMAMFARIYGGVIESVESPLDALALSIFNAISFSSSSVVDISANIVWVVIAQRLISLVYFFCLAYMFNRLIKKMEGNNES